VSAVLDEVIAVTRMVPLSEAVEVNPKLDRSLLTDDLDVSFVPMAAVEAASGGIDVTTIRKYAEVKKGYTHFREGDVLFAKVTPCMENGKMAIARQLRNGVGFGSTEFHVLRPRAGVDARYIYYFVSSQTFRKEASGHMTGAVGLRRVPSAFLEDSVIPLPHIDEQRRIVAELEKQFSRLDEAVANLKRVKANLKRYKASVLKDAVEGRLVPTEAELARREGRSFETGEQLLQRILETRRSTWKGKYDSPTSPVCPVDVEIPKGWTWVTVSQAMRERIVNGLSIKESQIPTEVRALRLSAMSDQGLDFDDFRCLPIDPAKVEDIVICESDFFVSRGNGSLELVGRGSPAQKPKQAIIFPDTMMRIRFAEVANVGPWFHALWSTRLVRRQIEKRVKTTAGIYKMAQPELASITIPLPPLAEQLRIVAEVDRRLSLVRGVESEVDANLKRAQSLRQSVLSKTFLGNVQSDITA
jgi:type I restriction enzyme S subunit